MVTRKPALNPRREGGDARPRVVVLCCEGVFQDFLLERAAEEFDLVGVVRYVPQASRTLSQRLSRYMSPRELAEYCLARAVLPSFERKARELTRSLVWRAGAPPRMPSGTPCIAVTDINSSEAIAFVAQAGTDLVLVNGTNLLRRGMLVLRKGIRWGFVNLHTGLSPYSRGGNCNLFMLLEGKPELVGITVHHVDLGIDRGDIILSDQVPVQADDNFEMTEVRCFHHGIECLLTAAKALCEGRAPRVKQWEPGKLFLKRTGYEYRPFHRLQANLAIRRGLIRGFLSNKAERNSKVTLVKVER